MHAVDITTGDVALETLREGDRGPSVARLQSKLSHLNFYAGAVTGQFDEATKQALEIFQREYELTETGYFGPQTWYALSFWSQETEVPVPSVAPKVKQLMGWIKGIASPQSEPLLASVFKQRAEPQHGQLHYWPFSTKKDQQEIVGL